MTMTDKKMKNSHESDQVLDLHPLMSMFDNDMDTVREILHEFIPPTQKTITELINAHREKSADRIEMAAHKLKSSARSVGACIMGDLCEKLEHAGKQGKWSEIDRLIPQLQPMMDDIVSRIKIL